MTGKRIGLVIGNNYPNSDKELRFAVADAIKMKEVLLNKDISEFDEVEESIDDTFVDARIKIEKILKNANRDDLVFIYFSGHGKKHLDNGLLLLFKDFKEDSPLATSLNFDYINRCIKYPSLKSVIIVLDCCYSGAAGIRDTSDVMGALKKHSGSGTIILSSTGLTGSSAAREEEKFGHGIFTHYLIEGLEKGYADKKGNGYISIDELYNYAFEKTKNEGDQSPKIEGSIEGSIFIGKNPQKIRGNEYNSKKSKLLSEYVRILHPLILNESLKILKKAYDVHPSLDSVENTIYDLLNSLLKGELQPDNYNDIVQHLKGISTSSESSRNKNKIDSSNPFTTTNAQRSFFQQVEYQSVAWKNQNYSLIQIQGEKYIPLKSDSKNKLATLVIDLPSEGEKYTIKTGDILDLGEGYGLEAKQIDVDGEKVWLEFTKDGEFVDDEIIKVGDDSDSTWTITLNNIQGENNVSVFKVHISRIFQGRVDSIVQINGLWLIDFKNAFTIKSSDKLSGYEIMEINDEYISYKSIDH